jgi:hypothetical protein
MHLYITLQQEIVLKSFMHVGFSILGTRATLVILIQRDKLLREKKNLTAAINSTPIMFQLFLMKRVL